MKKVISLLMISVIFVSTLSSCSLFVDYTIYTSTTNSEDTSGSLSFKDLKEIEFVSTNLGESYERVVDDEEKKAYDQLARRGF